MDFNAAKYEEAISNEFSIVNKAKKEVPFLPNRAQLDFMKQFEEHQDVILLKARKMGFSSIILAIQVMLFLFSENERLVSVSFVKESAQKQLERAKHFLKSYEIKNGIQVPLKYNSKNELVREWVSRKNGRPFRNTLQIGSAQSMQFGRGDDITFLHITEAAFARSIKNMLAGVGEACIPSAPKIFETTANGFGEFKDFYDEALLGKNEYKALFYGSEWEYDRPYIDAKRSSLGRIGIQEYPITMEEAFLTTGECYFDAGILGERIEEMKTKETIPFQFAA